MAQCCGPEASSESGVDLHLVAGDKLVSTTTNLRLLKISGGRVAIGQDDPEGFASDGEGPSRIVTLSPYRISATAINNAQFAQFVNATGYLTEAERAGESFVFYLQLPERDRTHVRRVVRDLPWWLIVPGACWRAPLGPGSNGQALADHPVVHVSWQDAVAFCQWAGVGLPSEAQWEHAARGGRAGERYPWGDEFEAGGQRRCNTWQGIFPNRPAEGWTPGTMPVDAFAPNGYGLFNTSGNVWEWCADWFNPDYHQGTAGLDPIDGRASGRRSQRGGSFLCHASWCNRYRSAARGANSPSSTTSHTGFRVVAPS
jgi:sulfatase modifying factor 1